MSKILIGNHYSKEVYEIVKKNIPANFEVQMLEEATQDNLKILIEDADYLIASGRILINETVIRCARKLKMIQRTGVGLDCIDLQCLKDHDIPLYVNHGVNAISVAEHTILLMLASIRNLVEIDKKTKEGIWEKQSQGIRTFEIKGKKIGLIGLGNIGKCVVQRLKGFQPEVFYFSRNKLKKKEEIELGVEFKSLDELLKICDIISIHCPLNEETRRMIGKKEIDMMKKNAIIVNTARGEIIDQKALIEGLKKKAIRAALDVYEKEPLPESSELRTLDNVILTPHVGGVTYDSFETMMVSAMYNIEFFEKGELETIQSCRVIS